MGIVLVYTLWDPSEVTELVHFYKIFSLVRRPHCGVSSLGKETGAHIEKSVSYESDPMTYEVANEKIQNW